MIVCVAVRSQSLRLRPARLHRAEEPVGMQGLAPIQKRRDQGDPERSAELAKGHVDGDGIELLRRSAAWRRSPLPIAESIGARQKA